MMSPLREQRGMTMQLPSLPTLAFLPLNRPFFVSSSSITRRASKRMSPSNGAAFSLSVPSSLRMLMHSRLWRLPEA